MTVMTAQDVVQHFPSPILLSCLMIYNLTDVIVRNQRFDSYVFKTHRSVNTWMSCAQLCLLRSLCESFNYNQETEDCEINWNSAAKTALGPFVSDQQWVYGDASKLPQGLIDKCAHHHCKDNQVCMPRNTFGNQCIDQDTCSLSDYAAITNATFDASMVPPRYTCLQGALATGNSVAYCEYTANGFRWNTSLRCVIYDMVPT